MARDPESTAITITLPKALDQAVTALADAKHCGNKSAAIREVLYKEAGLGINGAMRINETGGGGKSISEAEKRAVKYGARGKKGKE